MDTSVMFLDCPAYMDEHGAVRCGLPAAVEYRYAVSSTDGPLESAKIRCPLGHCFNGPVESLTWEKDPTSPGRAPRSDRPAEPAPAPTATSNTGLAGGGDVS
jgi:hypothetical protein